jgi:hypothetical protein
MPDHKINKSSANKENESKISVEKEKGGFNCCGCGEWVEFSDTIGTAHRNHCPRCLSSKHLDKDFSGDRSADCGGCMPAIGLSLKKEGVDKYGIEREGELMLIHRCSLCGRLSINRLASDDDEPAILKVFNESLSLPEETRDKLKAEGIVVLDENDKEKMFIKLFGKGIGKI